MAILTDTHGNVLQDSLGNPLANIGFLVNTGSFVRTGHSGSGIILHPLGTTTIGGTNDGGNDAGFVQGNRYVVSTTGALQSLSVYSNTASGNLILAVYDNNGAGGNPGNLVARTSSFAAVGGWQTIPTTTNPTLTSGNIYYLMYMTSSNSELVAATTTGTNYWDTADSLTYGNLPQPFPSAVSTQPINYSIYATLLPISTINYTLSAAIGFFAETDHSLIFGLGLRGIGNFGETGNSLNVLLHRVGGTPYVLNGTTGSFLKIGFVLTDGNRLVEPLGAFLYTGKVLTISLHRFLNENTANFIKTGHSSTTGGAIGHSLSENPASFIKTNSTITTKVNWHLTAAKGLFIETGNPFQVRSLVASTGSFVKTGFSLTDGRNFGGSSGTFLYTGSLFITTGQSTFLLTASTGSFVRTGHSFVAKFGLLENTGSFAKIGSPTAGSAHLIETVGSFGETGLAATTKVTWHVTASTGSFVKTNHSLAVGFGLSINPGSFTETGSSTTTKVTLHVIANTGSFAETGLLAITPISRFITAGTASFAETGNFLVPKSSFKLPAITGSFLKVGSPTSGSAHLSESLASFNRTGSSVVTKLTWHVTASTGSFIWTGHSLISSFGLSSGSFGETGNSLVTGFGLVANTGHFIKTGGITQGSGTLVENKGSFGETGLSATTKITWHVTVGTGSFVKTNHTIKVGFGLIESFGSFIESDYSLQDGSRFVGPSGVFLSTGQTLNFQSRVLSVVAGTGSFIKTGLSAVEGFGLIEITVPSVPANIVYTGSFSATKVTWHLAAAKGTFVRTGNPLFGKSLLASTGSFLKTGYSLVDGQQFLTTPASYHFTGSPAGIQNHVFVLVESGGIFLETDHSSVASFGLPESTGHFIEVGNPTQGSAHLLENTGSFNRTGSSVVTKLTWHTTASTGSFARTGNSFIAGFGVSGSSGSCLRTGHSFIAGFGLSANTASFNKTGSTTQGSATLLETIGSFSETGSLTTTKITWHTTVNTGNFVRTGHSFVASFGLPESSGSFIETDYSLVDGIKVSLNTGSFVETGHSIVTPVVQFSLVESSGSFIKSGHPLATKSLLASTGSFLKTGFSLIDGEQFLTAPASYHFTGSPAGIQNHVFVLVESGGIFFETGYVLDDGIQLLLNTGSFAETGQPTPVVKLLAVDTGSFAKTGHSFVAGFGLPESSGSFTETGNSRVISFGLPENTASFVEIGSPTAGSAHLLGDTGNFVRTGSSATTTLALHTIAGTGSFAETGHVFVTGFKASFYPSGSFARTGHSFVAGFGLLESKAIFVESGSPTEGSHSLAGNTGSFHETGSVVSNKFVGSITTSAGSFVRTGHSLVAKFGLPTTTISFVETGHSLVAKFGLLENTASFVYSGSAAFVSKHFQLGLNTGVLLFTGHTVSSKFGLSAATGVFAETGTNLDFHVILSTINSTGSYSFSVSPTSLIGPNKFVTNGVFSLTGVTLNITTDIHFTPTLAANTGNFVETGSPSFISFGLNASPGAFASTGHSGIFGLGIVANTGSFSLVGNTLNITTTVILILNSLDSAGNFVFTLSPIIAKFGLNVATGNFVTTGSLAKSQFGLLATSGIFSETGNLDVPSRTIFFAESSGTFIITPKISVLKIVFKMLASPTTFAINGQNILSARNCFNGSGNFVFSGHNAQTKAVLSINLSLGNLFVTGNTNFNYGFGINLPIYNFSFTGHSTTVMVVRNYSANSGIFSETGTTTNFTYSYQLNQNPGTFDFEGIANTPSFDHIYVVGETVGNFNLAGNNLDFASVFHVNPGHFSFTPQPILSKFGLPAASGHFALFANSIRCSYGLPASSTIYHFAQFASLAVTKGQTLITSPATFALTGNNVAITHGPKLNSTSYHLTGSSSSLVYGRVLEADGVFLFTGHPLSSYSLLASSGNFNYSGHKTILGLLESPAAFVYNGLNIRFQRIVEFFPTAGIFNLAPHTSSLVLAQLIVSEISANFVILGNNCFYKVTWHAALDTGDFVEVGQSLFQPSQDLNFVVQPGFFIYSANTSFRRQLNFSLAINHYSLLGGNSSTFHLTSVHLNPRFLGHIRWWRRQGNAKIILPQRIPQEQIATEVEYEMPYELLVLTGDFGLSGETTTF